MENVLNKFLILAFMILPFSSSSCWGRIEPEVFAQRCPVIISGKIVRLEKIKMPETSAVPKGSFYVIAYIKVKQTFKNVLKDLTIKAGDEFPVHMSPIFGTYTESTDIRYATDIEGIWLITLNKPAIFSIQSHPVQHQCLQNEIDLKKKGVFKIKDKRLRKEGCNSLEWIEQQQASMKK